jgi:hypothetical protein
MIFCVQKDSFGDLVAQLVEHNTFNVGAQGSNPCGITTAGESLLFYLRTGK